MKLFRDRRRTAAKSSLEGPPDEEMHSRATMAPAQKVDDPTDVHPSDTEIEAPVAGLPHTAMPLEPTPDLQKTIVPTSPRASEKPGRRRIWDMDGTVSHPVDEAPSNDATPGQPASGHISAEDVAQARLLIAQMSQGAGPTPMAEERNKTRILGFRAAELAAQDPFTQGKSVGQARGPDYPVGWIVVLSGPGQGACFTLTSGVSSIGRGQDQTICLGFGDNTISRQNHASVAYDDETRTFFLGHGGKSNIVRLNDRPVLSTEDLAHGDKIRLGETTLLFLALCGETFDWSDPDGGEIAYAAAE